MSKKNQALHSRFFIRAYMDEWPLASKAKQAGITSQPNNGEITIVVPDWVQSQLVCIIKGVYEPVV